jgi:pimeloyl-ACP methyl ester carboxylesterase
MRSRRGPDAHPGTSARNEYGGSSGRAGPGKRARTDAAGMRSGDALPAELRGRFEASLGVDLGDVRVHTDAEAGGEASAAGARAFAIGDDIVMGAGAYQPLTDDGQHLLAHEVVHTVQQRGAAPAPQLAPEVRASGDRHEQEADALAHHLVRGTPVPAAPTSLATHAIQRYVDGDPPTPVPVVPGRGEVILEQLAHRFAYQARLTEANEATLAEWGYRVHTPMTSGAGDLQLFAVAPLRDGVAPVLVFRGSESGADWIGNLSPAGVGMYQVAANEALIRSLLMDLGGGVTVTGHSLGGADAQIAAALYPELVSRVVTFQAPGVSHGMVERLLASPAGRRVESIHHIVDDDVVHRAGDEHTPGEAVIHRGRMPQSWDELGQAARALDGVEMIPHNSMPLAEEAEDRGELPAGARIPGHIPRRPYAPWAGRTTSDAVTPGLFETARTGLGYGMELGTGAELRAYTEAWFPIRDAADAGRTPWPQLLDRIAAAAVTEEERQRMRDNLRQLYPELEVADRVAGDIATGPSGATALVAAVGAEIPLDGEQQWRLRRHWTEALHR